MFERIRQLYLQGKLTDAQIETAVKKNLITKKQKNDLVKMKKNLTK